jgi:hypothetical protein
MVDALVANRNTAARPDVFQPKRKECVREELFLTGASGFNGHARRYNVFAANVQGLRRRLFRLSTSPGRTQRRPHPDAVYRIAQRRATGSGTVEACLKE